MPNKLNDIVAEEIAREYVGNGFIKSKALKTAGYSKNYSEHAGLKLFDDVRIKAAIARIQQPKEDKAIKNRQQRQEFWTAMINDKTASNSDRLRASELLGKSEADFTEGTIDRTAPIKPLTEEERLEYKRLAAIKIHKETG